MAYDAGPTPVVLRRATGSAPDDTTMLDLYVEGDLGGSSGPAEVAINPSGVRVPLKVDANGGLLLAGGGTGGTVEVDFSATNALLAQVRTAVQALLGADSPVPSAQLTALTSAISGAQSAIVAAQGGTTAATQSVLAALGPLQAEVVAVRTAVSAASTAEGTRDAATDVILGGLGSKLDVLTGTVAGLQSTLSVTLKPETITALSQGIRDNLSPLFSSLVDAVEDSAGGTDAAVVAAVQQVRGALTAAGGDTLATIVSALRTEDASRGTQAHTDAQALLSAALRTAVKLEAGLSITSPVTLDSAAMAALAPLSNLSSIASSTAAGATAAGQATQATKLDALKAATDAVTARLGQTLAVADSRLVFDANGRLTVAMDTSALATAAGQATQATKLDTLIARLESILAKQPADPALGGGKTIGDVVTALSAGSSSQIVASGTSATASPVIITFPGGTSVLRFRQIGTAASNYSVSVSSATDGSNPSSSRCRRVSDNSNFIAGNLIGSDPKNVMEVPVTGRRSVIVNFNQPDSVDWVALKDITLQDGIAVTGGNIAVSGNVNATVNNTVTASIATSGPGGSASTPLYATILTNIVRSVFNIGALAAGGSYTSANLTPQVNFNTTAQIRIRFNADQNATAQIKDGTSTTVSSHLPASAPLTVSPDTTAGPTKYLDYVDQVNMSFTYVQGGTAGTRAQALFNAIAR